MNSLTFGRVDPAIAFVRISVLLAALFFVEANQTPAWSQQVKGTVSVREPEMLTSIAVDGKILYERSCVSCHGQSGSGTKQGPPLVHDIYNPGHHPDEAFLRAAKFGVRGHHWTYGDMPPVEGVSEPMVKAIVEYIRALQAENGIVSRPHRM